MTDEGSGRAPVSIAKAVEAFLANPRRTASGNTYRAYTGVLTRLTKTLGTRRALADVDDEAGLRNSRFSGQGQQYRVIGVSGVVA